MGSPEAVARWQAIEAEWLARPGIGTKKMLQSAGLTGASGKVFASLVDGRLMLKLDGSRVAELIDTGVGQPLSSGGRTLREWVTVGVENEGLWTRLVDEAHDFVNGTG